MFNGLAFDQLHPQADRVADTLRTVNRDDVGVANAGEETAFLDDRRRAGSVGIGPPREQLQRHLAIETRIPSTIDAPERAAAEGLHDSNVPPCLGRRR